jgi:hypothetical protein
VVLILLAVPQLIKTVGLPLKVISVVKLVPQLFLQIVRVNGVLKTINGVVLFNQILQMLVIHVGPLHKVINVVIVVNLFILMVQEDGVLKIINGVVSSKVNVRPKKLLLKLKIQRKLQPLKRIQ